MDICSGFFSTMSILNTGRLGVKGGGVLSWETSGVGSCGRICATIYLICGILRYGSSSLSGSLRYDGGSCGSYCCIPDASVRGILFAVCLLTTSNQLMS